MFETEIKIALTNAIDPDDLLTECHAKSETPGKQLFQRDEYFDTTDELLREQDLTVRLRLLNGVALLALKGPRVFVEGAMHRRIELEFEVKDESEVREQLQRHKLVATAIIEKRRWTFHMCCCSIAVDDLPFIGRFVEIEGSGLEQIKNVMCSLGLSEKHAVRKNYTELLELKLPELHLPVRPNLRATFDAETQWKASRSRL